MATAIHKRDTASTAKVRERATKTINKLNDHEQRTVLFDTLYRWPIYSMEKVSSEFVAKHVVAVSLRCNSAEPKLTLACGRCFDIHFEHSVADAPVYPQISASMLTANSGENALANMLSEYQDVRT